MIFPSGKTRDRAEGAAEVKNAARTRSEQTQNNPEHARTGSEQSRTNPEHPSEQSPNKPEQTGVVEPNTGAPPKGGVLPRVLDTPPGRCVLRASDLTDLDRREITLWRVLGRWEEAQREDDEAGMTKLMNGFRKRLADYQRACDAEITQGALL